MSIGKIIQSSVIDQLSDAKDDLEQQLMTQAVEHEQEVIKLQDEIAELKYQLKIKGSI